jgi:cytochrome P450
MDSSAKAAEAEPNPFEAMDALAGDTRDPYPEFAEKRMHDPVWRGTLMDHSNVPPEFIPDEEWAVFRYEDVSRVFRDQKQFSSEGYNETIGLVLGPTILGMMGSPHREHRNLVAHAFKERSLQRWEPEFIAPVCHQLIDEVIEEGRADLVRALTFEFPVRVIVKILGLPSDDLDMFKRLSMQLIGIAGDMEAGFNASLALKEYFQVQIDARRSTPTDDVINDLVTAEVDGEKLTDEAIVSFLRLLLPAGVETTYRSSGNLLYLLLTHPDQLDAVRQDRSLVPQAIEEGLRRETPLTNVARFATADVELGGQTIPKGATVGVCMGSANHDESRWDNPETFDIFRPQIPHISFAAGPHVCLGMHLARLETRVALNVVLDRLADVALDPGDRDPHIRGMIFRSPTSLPVTFRAA